MLQHNITIYRSEADVLLIPQAVATRYIDSVRVLPEEATLFKHVTDKAHSDWVADNTIKCISCGNVWLLGTQCCLECHEPMTFRALHDFISKMPNKVNRSEEVWSRYHLAMHELSTLVDRRHADLIPLHKAPTDRYAAPPGPESSVTGIRPGGPECYCLKQRCRHNEPWGVLRRLRKRRPNGAPNL